MSDVTEQIDAAAMAYKPSLAMRVWKALGFRYSAYAGRPDDDEARYRVHRIVTHWDLRDRLRILFSGKTETEICVETEAEEKIKGTRSHAVALAPSAIRALSNYKESER